MKTINMRAPPPPPQKKEEKKRLLDMVKIVDIALYGQNQGHV